MVLFPFCSLLYILTRFNGGVWFFWLCWFDFTHTDAISWKTSLFLVPWYINIGYLLNHVFLEYSRFIILITSWVFFFFFCWWSCFLHHRLSCFIFCLHSDNSDGLSSFCSQRHVQQYEFSVPTGWLEIKWRWPLWWFMEGNQMFWLKRHWNVYIIPQHTVNTTFCYVIVYILHTKNKWHIRKLILWYILAVTFQDWDLLDQWVTSLQAWHPLLTCEASISLEYSRKNEKKKIEDLKENFFSI